MPDTGSITLIPISPAPPPTPPDSVTFGEPSYESVITLSRYAYLIGYNECAIFGVAEPNPPTYGCQNIWTKDLRDSILRNLSEAQEEIENVIGYFLSPKYVVDEFHSYKCPLILKHKHFISAGVQEITDLVIDEPVLHTSDPAIIDFPSAVTLDLSKIRIYYPDTSFRVYPSQVIQSGGMITLKVPRCRLVKYSLLENSASGLDYTDLSNFQDTVDIKYEEIDSTDHGVIIYRKDCIIPCADEEKTICVKSINPVIGKVELSPASYDGSWKYLTISSTGIPTGIKINYLSGLSSITYMLEQIIVRLAHSKMPEEPCGCETVQRMWQRDRNIPKVLTRERLNCPFGFSDGAWTAWQFIQDFIIHESGLMH